MWGLLFLPDWLVMGGSVEVFTSELNLENVDPLPEDFDPTAVIKDPLPSLADDAKLSINGEKVEKNGEVNKRREIVLGKNVHTSCLEVTEPDVDDEVTGEREAYMAGVLARYRKALLERTKHHLGNKSILSLVMRTI